MGTKKFRHGAKNLDEPSHLVRIFQENEKGGREMIAKMNRSLQWRAELAGRRRSASKRILFLAAGFGLLFMLLGGSATVLAQEAVSQETPTPSSVDEILNPMDRAFEKKPPREEPEKPVHPFLRDQKLDLNVRTYYLYKDKYDDSRSEAWAVGGALRYKSGYLFDRLALGAGVYTSQPVYAPDDRDGTLLLKSGQEEYTVLGRYGRSKSSGQLLRFYRQEYDTPFINKTTTA
jgi:hypothetical protein